MTSARTREAATLMAAPVRRARSVRWRHAVRVQSGTGVVVTLTPTRGVPVAVASVACAIAAQATESVRAYGRAARTARREADRLQRDGMMALARAERIAGNAATYAVAGRSAEHGAALADAMQLATAIAARMDSARARADIAQRAYDAWKQWVIMPDGDPYAAPSDAAIRRARRAIRTGATRGIWAVTVHGDLLTWDVDATRAVIDSVRRETVKAAALDALKDTSPGTVDPRDGTERRARVAARYAAKRKRLSDMSDAMSRLSVLYASA
jgi:hypothetical protein